MQTPSDGLIFGIYPGGASGTADGQATQGSAESPDCILSALDQLQGDKPFIVRAYEPYIDGPDARIQARQTPEFPLQYLQRGRRLDLVVMFQSLSGNVSGYCDFVRQMVRQYGLHCDTIQITEEANLPHSGLDGERPNVREALVKGIIAARDEACARGYDYLKIGFNAVPSFNPADDFWTSLGQMGGSDFVAAVDYVGLDFFPDVFRPVAPDGEPGDLSEMVVVALKMMRETWMTAAGIPPTVPMHITENGWPTSLERSYERQAQVLETVIRTIHKHRQAFNIARYELFDLRDGNSSNPDIFHQFGLMRDDYTPKPGFETYRRLIAELSA
jgi:hypothetical protein